MKISEKGVIFIAFVVGLFVGGAFGMFVSAVMAAASQSDMCRECELRKKKEGDSK